MDYSAEDDAAPVDMLASLFAARGWPCELVSEDEMTGEVQGSVEVPWDAGRCPGSGNAPSLNGSNDERSLRSLRSCPQ